MKGPWGSSFGVFQGWFVISFTSGSPHSRYLICATSKRVHRETTQHHAQGSVDFLVETTILSRNLEHVRVGLVAEGWRS